MPYYAVFTDGSEYWAIQINPTSEDEFDFGEADKEAAAHRREKPFVPCDWIPMTADTAGDAIKAAQTSGLEQHVTYKPGDAVKEEKLTLTPQHMYPQVKVELTQALGEELEAPYKKPRRRPKKERIPPSPIRFDDHFKAHYLRPLAQVLELACAA